MPTNFLILPLLAGFLFVNISHRFRFRAQRLDGYRLLLESAFAGAVLVTAARILVVGFRYTPWWASIHRLWIEGIGNIPYLGTGVIAVLLGGCGPWLWNHRPGRRTFWRDFGGYFRHFPRTWKRTNESNTEAAIDREIKAHGDGLIKLLQYAATRERLISVTLDNGKWYAGEVGESLNLDPQEAYFRLLPLFSGYRDKDTLRLIQVLSYAGIYLRKDVDKREFEVTIPLKGIKTASLWNQGAYEEHNREIVAQDSVPGSADETGKAETETGGLLGALLAGLVVIAGLWRGRARRRGGRG